MQTKFILKGRCNKRVKTTRGMNSLDTADIILISINAVLALLLSLFIYQTVRKNRHAHVMTLGLLFGLMGVSIFSIQIFLPDLLSYGDAAILANGVFYILMFYSLFIHFERVNALAPRLVPLAIMSGLAAVGLTTSAVILGVGSSSALILLNNFAHDAIRGLVLLLAAFTAFRGWLLTHEREGMMEWVSLLILAIGGIPTILGNYTEIDDFLGLGLYEWGDLVTFIGLLILVLIYIYNPDYLYRMPVPIHGVIMYNSTGIATYSRQVRNKGFEATKMPDELMSMSITAISSVLSESLHGSAELRHIDAKFRILIFETRGDITVMLICAKATYFLRRSLKLLLHNISDSAYEVLAAEAYNKTEEIETEVDHAVKSALPYLVFLQQ